MQNVLKAIQCLTLYRDIFKDPILLDFKELLGQVAEKRKSAVETCFDMLAKLLARPTSNNLSDIDLFRNHLLDSITGSENAFSLAAEGEIYANLDSLLLEALKHDLRLLKVVYDFDLLLLLRHIRKLYHLDEYFPGFEHLKANVSSENSHMGYYGCEQAAIKHCLACGADWSEDTEKLHAFLHKTGSGIFGRFWAFRWNALGEGSGLCGVAKPDPIRIKDLVGYEDQKKEITRNTRQFVDGRRANNVLLYGDRGTGKSSTIKSLVHLFGRQGLRLLEISKHDLLSLHSVVAAINGRPQRFIIFIDDLSFEEDETEYKELKALLEGSVAKPPENVLVYATSNRRNLVREYFGDRVTDEVGVQDTYQEKLSLADRFGIKLVYPAPGKLEFLNIVEDMAAKSGIKIDRSELHELATRWVLWHNARSGRTARQFIDDLKGRLG